MANKKFGITAIIGVNSSAMASGLAKASAKLMAWSKATMAKMFNVAKAGAMVAGGAVGIFAAKSLKEFGNFEQGMNEVFTLLPGISKKAMDEMSKQALQVSKELGVMPEETVPALYQALSAGVPQKNVFDFMRVAGKAAIGGVTSLETAVDGLSTVVNTYGIENISAQKAADLMFTTVKLGKTNFEELSGALYNVLPIAKSAGVNFETVSAAMATLTAKGVPTAQATTQLRAAIQSLGAPTKRQRSFMESLGINVDSLKTTLKGPGGLTKAMQMLTTAVDGDMEALRKMLGSVEAVQAVLGLTANPKDFAAALEQMGVSAGAANDAFDQMDKGFLKSLEKMLAALKVVMIGFGKTLMPLFEKLEPKIFGLIDAIDKIPWVKIGTGIAGMYKTFFKPTVDLIVATIRSLPWMDLVNFLKPVIGIAIKTFELLGKAFANLSPMIIPLLKAMAGWFSLFLVRIALIVAAVESMSKGLGKAWAVIFQTISNGFAIIFDPSKERVELFIKSIKAMFKMVPGFIMEALSGLFDFVAKHLGKFYPPLESFVLGLKNNIIGALTEAFKGVGGFLEFIGNTLKGLVGLLANGANETGNFAETWALVRRTAVETLVDVRAALWFFIDTLKEAFNEMQGGMGSLGSGAKTLGTQFGRTLGALLGGLFRILPIFIELVGEVFKLAMAIGRAVLPAVMKLIPIVLKLAGAFLFFLFKGLEVSIPIVVWLLTKVWGVIKAILPVVHYLVDAFGLGLKVIIEGIKVLVAVIKGLYDAVAWVVDKIVHAFVFGFHFIGVFLKKIWDGWMKLIEKFGEFVEWVLFGNTVTKDFKRAFDFITEVISAFFKMFISGLSAIDKIFKNIFNGMRNLASSVVGSITSAFSKMSKAVMAILNKLGSVGGKVLKGLGGLVKGTAKAVTGVIGSITGGGGGAPEMGRVVASSVSIAVAGQLRPALKLLGSMDRSLKSIDNRLKGKFVNQ